MNRNVFGHSSRNWKSRTQCLASWLSTAGFSCIRTGWRGEGALWGLSDKNKNPVHEACTPRPSAAPKGPTFTHHQVATRFQRLSFGGTEALSL